MWMQIRLFIKLFEDLNIKMPEVIVLYKLRGCLFFYSSFLLSPVLKFEFVYLEGDGRPMSLRVAKREGWIIFGVFMVLICLRWLNGDK